MPDSSRILSDFSTAVADLEKNVDEYRRFSEDVTTVRISNNLLQRHTQLYVLEEYTRKHRVHQVLLEEYNKKKSRSNDDNKPPVPDFNGFGYGKQDKPEKLLPEERVYRLAVTDLFVEKAQAFLEQRAESYQRSGKNARWIASVIIIIGAVLSWNQMTKHSGGSNGNWINLTGAFTRAFTAYGMIVLAAVGFWKYSKAMLDQAERLYERRHALRQGRLFVHLKDGVIDIDEMEKAFRWNDSQENAFASINTDAAAPWGGVLKEFAKSFPEIFKTGLQNIGKGKSDDK